MSELQTYVKARFDTSMGQDKPVCVTLANDVWHALEQIARKKNKNKSFLLRPVVTAFVEAEMKRMLSAKSK